MTATLEISSEVLPADAMTPAEAVAWITEAYVKSVASIVETGQRLRAAKAKVPHGRWGQVIEELPFSESTARRLIQIAEYPAFGKPRTCARLPASWGTLAVLTQVPPDEFPALIASGAINADMTRADATALAQTYQAGRIEALNQWVGLADAITGALSRANDHERLPADLPGDYPTSADLISRAQALVARLESLR